MNNTEILHFCELIGGPFDGHKYTESIFQQNKFVLTPNGHYAIYSLSSGRWDSNKNMHFNRLEFKGYKNANN